jgi:mannose-6-phosphate isomerase-like protein (cupin superfamily)
VGERRFQVTRIDELERIPLEGKQWRPIRRALGVTGFGINAYTAADAGDEVVEPHDETSAGAGGHEELYLVVSGAAEFEIDGERVDAPTGTMILIPVAAHRVATAAEAETTVLVIGGVAGSMRASPFEYWYAAQGPYSHGEYEEAFRMAAEGLADYPEHPSLHYQLACYQALAGNRDEALEHLRIAEAGNPQVLEWADGDPDLDSIRDDPRYPG